MTSQPGVLRWFVPLMRRAGAEATEEATESAVEIMYEALGAIYLRGDVPGRSITRGRGEEENGKETGAGCPKVFRWEPSLEMRHLVNAASIF